LAASRRIGRKRTGASFETPRKRAAPQDEAWMLRLDKMCKYNNRKAERGQKLKRSRGIRRQAPVCSLSYRGSLNRSWISGSHQKWLPPVRVPEIR